MLRRHFKRRNYYAAATAPRPEYRWCGVEQVDQAAPIPTRSNGWRYLGPRQGETYRRQAVFGPGFRLRLPFPRLSPGPGHRWFNSHPLGGDPDLPDFRAWARTMLRRRLVHRDDADAWRAAFVHVEGGGHGQLVVSAADETWRVILCWGSRGRRIDVNQQGIPTSLVDLQVRAGVISEDPRFRQLNIACFGHRLVRYDPLTEFGTIWKERLPGACLAVLVADSWRDCQVGLLARDRRRFGFRDVDPLTGAFMDSRVGGRSKKGVQRAPPNALDGGNYFRNLYSIMLERDVGSSEFSAWISGEKNIPSVTVRHLEKWLTTTKASVVVWSHRGSGAEVVGPEGQTTSLRPRALHVGVREGHVYRLVLDGPWKDRFNCTREGDVGPSLDVAVEHCVRTRRLFRRIADATEEEKSDGDTRTFGRCADMTKAILASSQTETDQQTARKRRRGVDEKADTKKTWYAPPGTALDEFMLHLHLGGVACTGRLTSYSHWDSLSLPAHGLIVRSWCGASMGGLDPDLLECDEATRLIELHGTLGRKLIRGVMDFRVSSEYSPSLLALLEVCWRGPIVGAEDALGTTYGPGDWQCDINGAHTAAMLDMENLPAFTHVDEVQAFDGHDIEDWSLYVVRLDAGGDPDVFLNADVTPVFGQNYKRYLALVHTPAPHRVTHFVRPARTIQKCHIPGLVQDLLARDLGEPLLQDAEAARRFKKGLLVRTSGLLQQRHADRINAVMVTTSEEAMAVGGKIVPVLGEVNRIKSELRTSGTDGELGIEKLDSGDAYLCFEASRVWYRDGFWALGTLILDETRLRVLEVRKMLEACGGSAFSYQCDAVFFKGPLDIQEEVRRRYEHFFSGELKTPGTLKFEPALKHPESPDRVFAGIEVKLALNDLPPAMRTIPCPRGRALRVIPLWGGIGETFGTMEAAHAAWRAVGKDDKRKMWPDICAAESPATLEQLLRELMSQEDRVVCAVTGEHGGAGKSYCALRAAKTVFKTGLVLTPTNSLRTSYTDLPPGWSVRTADHQLGFYIGDDAHVRKTAGSIHIPRVDVVIIEEAAYMSLHALSMILAASHSTGAHVIGTYDTHQLQPVRESSGMSISVDNVDRQVVLERSFPTCFHLFARKRDRTIDEQVEMDDSLLYILDAGDNSAKAQTRALERFGGVGPSRYDPHVSDFHLAYTRDCARFHAFRGLTRCNEAGGWDALGQRGVVGAQYRDLGKTGKVHKNHAYRIVRWSVDSVVVQSAFDDGATLEETTLSRAAAEILFDPPGSCTVHAVQGRTVEGKLVIHQARHRFSDVYWLYTAISRATGPSNVVVLDDVHRSVSNMPENTRRSWATRKVSSYLRADVAAGRLDDVEGRQHKDALVEELLRSYRGRCNSCSTELVWAVYSERQPTTGLRK